MLTLLAALMLSATGPECGPAHLDACGGLYEMVGKRWFDTALRRFIGPGRATWVFQDEDKTEQVLAILGGPSDGYVRLPDDLLRFEGCFPHNCPERGTVYFAPDGQIKAVALMYFDCRGAKQTCTGEEPYTLTILLREHSDALIADARAWAEQSVLMDYKRFPYGWEPIGATQIVIAAN